MIVSVSVGKRAAEAATFRVRFFLLALAQNLDIARILGSAKNAEFLGLRPR
jgi:hypothetical protein